MIKLFTVKAYIKHFFKSSTKFKIHSPFAYDLVTKVFKEDVPVDVQNKITKKRKKLYANKTVLEIVDFGAVAEINGTKNSRSRKSSKKTVSYKSGFKAVNKIAKSALLKKKYADLLFKLTRHFEPENIVELGTSLGITTATMAMGNPNSRFFSMEGCASIAAVAQQNLKKLDVSNVEIKLGEFGTTIPEVLNELDKVDLVFFDGNHRKKATLDYFNQFLPLKTNDSIFVFDDIYWSKGMSEAWQAIKSHPDVTLSIDLFQMGIVFFKKELSPQHISYRF